MLRSEIPNEGSQPHAFNDETGPREMNSREKIASGVVDPRQLSQIDFDLSVWAQRKAPGVFCFSDPRALQSAREFQPAYLAFFVNRDA
jgi:hypothetical protein